MKKYRIHKVLSELFLWLTFIIVLGVFLLANIDKLDFVRNISEQLYVAIRGEGHVFNARVIGILKAWLINISFVLSIISVFEISKVLRISSKLLKGLSTNLYNSETVYTSSKHDNKKMKKDITKKNKEEKKMFKKLNLKAKKEAKRAAKIAKKAAKVAVEETKQEVKTEVTPVVEKTKEIVEVEKKHLSDQQRRIQDIFKNM